MAMNLSQADNANGDPDVMVEMNTTPLIDVMLVLLVMLIITIPLQMHAVNVEMPVGAEQAPPVPPKVVKIEVNANSQVLWDGQVIPDRVTLMARMQAETLLGVEKQPEIHFMPNRAAKYDVVAGVMATAQRAGLQKIGMANIDEFAPAVARPTKP
jgi:biopolymer transport protein ExbD